MCLMNSWKLPGIWSWKEYDMPWLDETGKKFQTAQADIERLIHEKDRESPENLE